MKTILLLIMSSLSAQQDTIRIDTCGPVIKSDTAYLQSGAVFSVSFDYLKLEFQEVTPDDTCAWKYVDVYHLTWKETVFNDGLPCRKLEYYVIEYWIYACGTPFMKLGYGTSLKTTHLGPCPTKD